jgi:high-affinity iron transporter
MKFIFKIGPAASLPLLALGFVACTSSAPPPAAPDGGDAQRLVALLDYVGGDYGRAVQDGQVVSAFEYEEQLRFVSDARRMAGSLLGPTPAADDRVLPALARVDELVRARARADEVTAACRAAREDAIARFELRTTPTERPSLPRAQQLYAEGCATCHGARGDADTDRARELDPQPASFRDPERLGGLAPYRVYNALTFGVPGTAMASFDSLSPADRWSLAFYVFRLGHEGAPARPPVAMPLADLAIRTDRELQDALRAVGHPDPPGGVVHARREAAFQEPPAGVGIDATRRMLRQALRGAQTGDFRAADRHALDAYLQGFEPLEPRLRVRDPRGTLEVEEAFGRLRGAIARGDAAAARQHGEALEVLLSGLGGGGASRPALAAFVIYFREGVEAALLVAALLAGLARLGRPDARRYIHFGWLAALPAGALTWWLAERVVRLGADRRELVEGVVGLLAAAVLFSVSFWMISRAESRHWMGYLRRRLETTLSRRSLVLLAGLSFLAVYREAAETILFTQALLMESAGHHAQVWTGAVLGLLAVAAIGLAMGRSVMKLPLGPFFAVSGTLLCLLAVSFAGSGLHELVTGGYLAPRPVRFPTVPWLGVYPDRLGLLVQLAIVSIVALSGLTTLWRGSGAPPAPVPANVPDPGSPA